MQHRQQWQNDRGETPVEKSHGKRNHDAHHDHVHAHGNNVATQFGDSVDVLLDAIECFPYLRIAVVGCWETIDVPQQRNANTKDQLLRDDRTNHRRKIAHAHTREVHRAECSSADQYKPYTASGNGYIDQPLYDQWISKSEPAGNNDANQICERQRKQWSNLPAKPSDLLGYLAFLPHDRLLITLLRFNLNVYYVVGIPTTRLITPFASYGQTWLPIASKNSGQR